MKYWYGQYSLETTDSTLIAHIDDAGRDCRIKFYKDGAIGVYTNNAGRALNSFAVFTLASAPKPVVTTLTQQGYLQEISE